MTGFAVIDLPIADESIADYRLPFTDVPTRRS
jgi:hypothetical protein